MGPPCKLPFESKHQFQHLSSCRIEHLASDDTFAACKQHLSEVEEQLNYNAPHFMNTLDNIVAQIRL